VLVEGIEIPVEQAAVVLEQLRAGELPAHKEKPVPGTTYIGPGKEPILLPGKVEEPKTEQAKPSVDVKKVEPNIPPKEVKKDTGSDRIIIFTNIKRADERKAIEVLSKAIGKPVNVMSVSDRKVKTDYPSAKFYVLGIEPEEGEDIFPKEAYDLLQKKMTKDTKARLREIFEIAGVEKAPTKKAPKEEPAPKKEESAPKEEPKKEPKKIETKPEEQWSAVWDDAKVLEPGKAQYEDTIATVNADVIDNFTDKSQTGVGIKEADNIVIWLKGKFTGAELMSSSGALQSYFGKETTITVDGAFANSKIEAADRKHKSVAAFVWDRESFRSVMSFSKAETQPSITATVENAVLKLANKRFYNRLQKAAEFNDPYLMAQMMLQYSEAIEDKDEELSIQLIAKAQELLDE
jgi:hypothetical protein